MGDSSSSTAKEEQESKVVDEEVVVMEEEETQNSEEKDKTTTNKETTTTIDLPSSKLEPKMNTFEDVVASASMALTSQPKKPPIKSGGDPQINRPKDPSKVVDEVVEEEEIQNSEEKDKTTTNKETNTTIDLPSSKSEPKMNTFEDVASASTITLTLKEPEKQPINSGGVPHNNKNGNPQ